MLKKILIVEDELPLRKALREKLKKEKFDVIEAKNGEDGLAMAKKEKPDLILLDIIMPRMDGIAMLKELRKDTWGKDAQVIMLTALEDGEKVLEALKNGAYDFLVKADWSIEDIIKKIKEKI